MLSNSLRFVVVLLLVLLSPLAGCATQPGGPSPIPPDNVPALAVAVAVVAMDIRGIIESEEPTAVQVQNLLNDLDAIPLLVEDDDIRAQVQSIIDVIRAASYTGLAVRSVLIGHEADLRSLRDALTRRAGKPIAPAAYPETRLRYEPDYTN